MPGCAVRDDDDRDTTHAVADPSKTTAQKRLGLLRPAGQAHPEAAGRSTNQMPVRSKSLLAGVASSIIWGQRTRTSFKRVGCMHGWLVGSHVPSTRPRHDGETTAKPWPWPWPCVHLWNSFASGDGLIIDETNRMHAMRCNAMGSLPKSLRQREIPVWRVTGAAAVILHAYVNLLVPS